MDLIGEKSRENQRLKMEALRSIDLLDLRSLTGQTCPEMMNRRLEKKQMNSGRHAEPEVVPEKSVKFRMNRPLVLELTPQTKFNYG